MKTTKLERRQVPAKLIEATPNAAGQWLLASPMIVFIGWLFLDIFAYLSPIPWRWLDMILGAVVFMLLIVLPFGLAAHRLVTSFPRLFQHAGWDVEPLETVSYAEIYMVRYMPQESERAPRSWSRMWLRAAQGWVYLEITAILVGFVALGPLYFSALNMGFGK